MNSVDCPEFTYLRDRLKYMFVLPQHRTGLLCQDTKLNQKRRGYEPCESYPFPNQWTRMLATLLDATLDTLDSNTSVHFVNTKEQIADIRDWLTFAHLRVPRFQSAALLSLKNSHNKLFFKYLPISQKKEVS